MGLSFCKIREAAQCVIDWKNGIDVPWSTTDLDEQTLSVDCDAGTLAISNGNSVPLDALGTRTIYRLAPNTSPGIRNREWHDSAPAIPIADSDTAAGRAFRLGHDFTLPTTTDTVVAGLNLNDTDNTAGELDVQVMDTVITVPAGGVWIQYQGGSEGYWAVEVGYCCGTLELIDELGYQDREDANAIVGPVFLPEGQHQYRAWNIDSGGTNSSHAARYSTDGITFAPGVPAGVEFSLEKRPVECEEANTCEPIPEGWDICPPPECGNPLIDPDPTVETNGLDEAAVQALIDAQDHDDPAPGSIVPIPDNELDTAIRVGNAGFSNDYARADHNHPIRRQSNPGDPVVVAGGDMNISQALILDRWSTEETYSYRFRVRGDQPAGTGWGWITIPAIAGFQQPKIGAIGTYRSSSNRIQNDDGVQGAAPRGPYMGAEAHHWSSTNRVYAGFFRRDEANTSTFYEFTVDYLRT